MPSSQLNAIVDILSSNNLECIMLHFAHRYRYILLWDRSRIRCKRPEVVVSDAFPLD